ncbi:MAG TPA: hypothetical protein VK470_10965 [Bacteroidota bacterium]|nr:hypothetical protein [Bacteroidota bacterium]
MKLILLSIICSAVLGVGVAVFLRFVKFFDKRYEDFEDERFRAAAGPSAEAAAHNADEPPPAKNENLPPPDAPV